MRKVGREKNEEETFFSFRSFPASLDNMASPRVGIEMFIDDHFIITSVALVVLLSVGRILVSKIFGVRFCKSPVLLASYPSNLFCFPSCLMLHGLSCRIDSDQQGIASCRPGTDQIGRGFSWS